MTRSRDGRSKLCRDHRAPVGLALLLALVLGASGCASWRGARLYQSGSAALSRGDLQRAIGDLEAAARLVPHGSEIQNHLGIAYAEVGRDEDARLAFQRAVALDCDNRAAQRNLAASEVRGAEAARLGGASAEGRGE